MSVKDLSVFSIMGPIMVGPSSSHTAGAVRLAGLARLLLGGEPAAARFFLHGSFDKTGQGHGTHRALIAGLLGFAPDDERVPHAPELAAQQGLKVEFQSIDLGDDAHPNTVRFELKATDGHLVRVTGSSIGGGQVLVTEFNGFPVELRGQYPTLITVHTDQPGVVAEVTRILADRGVNIAFLRLSRAARGETALLVAEVDHVVPEEAVAALRSRPGIRQVIAIPGL